MLSAYPDDATVVTVLVADVDQQSRRLVAATLRHAGYTVELARSPKETISLLRRRRLGAIVVDPSEVSHPSSSGTYPPEAGGTTTKSTAVDVVQNLRRQTDIPIVVLSHLAERDRVAVLNAGADDYLSKPFGVEELLARLGAALRRASPALRRSPPVVTPDFTVDPGAHRLWLPDGSEVLFTPTEWRIVEALVRRPGYVVGHADLLEEVWGVKARAKTEYLRVYVAGIRKKTEPDPARPRYFITYPGIGHVFLPEGRPTITRTVANTNVVVPGSGLGRPRPEPGSSCSEPAFHASPPA